MLGIDDTCGGKVVRARNNSTPVGKVVSRALGVAPSA